MNSVMQTKVNLNKENIAKIDPKYDDLITDVVVYIRLGLTGEDGEEAINDILEILLGAQSRGEKLESIIGEDYKGFCDEIINSYMCSNNLYSLLKFKEIVWIVLKSLPFFIAIDCIFSIGKAEVFTIENLLKDNYTLGIMPIITAFACIPVIYFIFNYISENSFRNNKVRNKLLVIIYITYIFGVAGIGYLLKGIVILVIPNYFICSILSILVIMGYAYFSRKSINK